MIKLHYEQTDAILIHHDKAGYQHDEGSQLQTLVAVGVFEPHREGETVTADKDSQSVFLRSIEFVRFQRYLNSSIQLDGYTFNTTAYNGFLLSQHSK